MIASNIKGVHTIENAEKVADLFGKADKYMSKQLTRTGGKVFGKYGSIGKKC